MIRFVRRRGGVRVIDSGQAAVVEWESGILKEGKEENVGSMRLLVGNGIVIYDVVASLHAATIKDMRA